MKTLLSAMTLMLATTGAASAAEWELDRAHTTVSFSVRHMMVSTVRGVFAKVGGAVQLDDQDPRRSSLTVTIDAASIDTQEPKRDEHLRSPDFFDVAKHPTITFQSTKVESAGKATYKVTGDLTMHGVTRPVTLDVATLTSAVQSPWGQMVRGFSATATLNRKDWGLTWNKALETGGFIVSDEVVLQLDGELLAKAPATN